MSVPVLEATHLSKWYGQVIGLSDVTVAVQPGITALLGPNGSGKSTFMKLVTGQLRPSQGDVRLFGVPVWGQPAVYTRLGFCPEQDAFYERMTGREWLEALTELQGRTPAEAREAAVRALEMLALVEVADRRIGGYSKGMRQRLKLAQAMAHDPDLLVLDEPLTGLDPVGRQQIVRVIRDRGREGRSVLVSSHILHEVQAMTSTILLMNEGRLLAEGSLHRIRELLDAHPHTVAVRTGDPRGLARELLAYADVTSLRFEPGTVVVQTSAPDAFYARLTTLVASGACGPVEEIVSPDDNLQAVFRYLVAS